MNVRNGTAGGTVTIESDAAGMTLGPVTSDRRGEAGDRLLRRLRLVLEPTERGLQSAVAPQPRQVRHRDTSKIG